MKKEKLTDLIHAIEGVQQRLHQIKQGLEEELNTTRTPTAPRRRSSSGSAAISDQELTRAYLELRERFKEAGPRSVEDFAAQRTASYLDRFVRANNLPIPTKTAKAETVEALSNYLARSVLIRGA